jgi:alpha-tubulin suppressor-like RCC1 family protein
MKFFYTVVLIFCFSCEDSTQSELHIEHKIGSNIYEVVEPIDIFDKSYNVGEKIVFGVEFFHKIDTQVREASSVEWSSTIDGIISNEQFFESSDLSEGQHILKVEAFFEDNSSFSFSDTLTILYRNKSSHIQFYTPNTRDSYYSESLVNFKATVLSLLNDSLEIEEASWFSDLDGELGSGLLLDNVSLSSGNHRISLLVKFSDQSELSSTVDIYVKNFERVKKVATDGFSTFFITTNNDLWGVGRNHDGQLGLGTRTDVYFAKNISANISDIAVNSSRTVLTNNNGELLLSGSNYFGVFGDGTRNLRTTFQNLLETDVKMFSFGSYNSFLIKADQTLWVSGSAAVGDTILGSVVTQQYMFMKVDSGVSKVFGGHEYSAIIKNDSSLWAEGRNNYGQLGDDTTTDRNNYVHIMNNVKFVSTGFRYMMIIDENNNLWATGNNDSGQFGNGTSEGSLKPIFVMAGVKDVAAAGGHTAILKLDNSLWLVGSNSYGQLGDGTFVSKQTPTRVMSDVISVSVGNSTTVAVKSDNTVWIWGSGIGAGDLINPTPNLSVPTQIKF